MKSVHINTYCTGGAAKACLRIVKALQKIGNEATMLVLYKTVNDKNIFDFRDELGLADNYLLKIKNKLQVIKDAWCYANKEELFSSYNSVWNLHNHSLVKEAEVVNLHWTKGFVDYKSFFSTINKKTIITLHDYYPISGGYHYPNRIFEDEKFARVIKKNLKLVESCYRQNKIQLVGPSSYIIKKVQQNPILNAIECHVVKNPVGTEYYYMADKGALRLKKGLTGTDKVLVYVNEKIRYKRKGYQLFEQMVPSFLNKGYYIVVIGEINKHIRHEKLIQTGYISSDVELNEWYNAADVLLFSSLDENLPNIVSESLCSGTPVIAFDNGGINEMIVEGINGRLIKDSNISLFIEAVNSILTENIIGLEIGKRAREVYSEEIAALKYNQIYKGDVK